MELFSTGLLAAVHPNQDRALHTGVDVVPGTAVTGDSIDVAVPLNTISIAASTTTLTFSGTPSTGTRVALRVTNTDAAAHTITIPSAWSEATSANRTTLPIPASNGVLTVLFEREAARWAIYGDPITADPEASQSEMETGTETAIRLMSPLRVAQSHAAKAPLASPAFTGTPTAPTAATATNTTQLATTAFVHAVAAEVEADGATGDVKFIPDAFSVPSGWSLTGVNGIPTFTTPDADYKPVVKTGGTVANVTFDPVAGEVADDSTVALATATPDASIRYTVDGGTPTRSSGTVYSGPITITDAVTIKAIAYLDFWIDSAVTEAAYTVPAGTGLKTNLLAHWSMDEVSGNAADSHTNGYDLIQQGTVASAAGKLGNSREFTTNLSNYFSPADTTPFRFGANPFSVSLWVYSNANEGTQSQYPALISISNTSNEEWTFMVQSNNGRLEFKASSDGSAATALSAGAMAVGSWKFYALVWDGANIKVSVDGAAFTSAAFAGPIFGGTATLMVGRRQSGGQAFAGRLDEISVWSGRALAIEDVGVIYNSGAGLAYSSW